MDKTEDGKPMNGGGIQLHQGFNPGTLSTLENNELNSMMLTLQGEMIKRLTQQYEQMKRNHDEQLKKLLEIEHQQEQIVRKQTYISSIREDQDYCNITNLGKKVSPTISNQRMPKLLRFAGIILKYERVSTPYRQYLEGVNPLVKEHKEINSEGVEYIKYSYHAGRVWEKINRKLREEGLYQEFTSCRTASEVHRFIDEKIRWQ